MAGADKLFKDDEQERSFGAPNDDELRHITGISHDDEKGMDAAAAAGSRQDLANRERPGFYNPGGDAAGGIADRIKNIAGLGDAVAGAGAAGGAAAALGGPAGMGAKLMGSLFGSRKRKSVTGGAIGLFITGLIFTGITISSGPLQFIHLAELLKQFHSQEHSDESDDRLGRLVRYARSGGEVEETRLGYFANKYSHVIEARLNTSGIVASYDKAGNFLGYEVDRENGNFKGMSDDEIKSQFKEQYGVDIKTEPGSDGKLLINPEKGGYFANRRLVGSMLKEADYKGLSGAISARISARKAGLSLSPIKQLDSAITKKGAAAIKKAMNRQVSEEVEDGDARVAATETEPDENNKDKNGQAQTDPEATSASDDSNKAITDVADNAAGDAASEEKARVSLKAKIAGGGAALVGIVCTIKALDDGAKEAKEVQTVLPLMRLGGTFVSVGSQMQYGGKTNPTFNEQAGDLAEKFFYSNQKGNTGTWANAQSIQAELGEKQDGVAPDSVLTSITAGSPLAFINSGALGEFASYACGKIGQLALGVFSFVTGPASFVVSFAAGQALAASGVIDDVINALVGKTVNLATLAGPQFGNYVNFGYKMFTDQQAVTSGARQLTSKESAELSARQEEEANQEFQSHGFAYRVFSPDTSRSLFGSLIDAQNPSIMGNITQLAGSFLHFGSTLMSAPMKLMNATVHAAPTSYQYGDLPNYGFSEAELNDPNVANPYTNASYVIDPNNNIMQTKDASGNAVANQQVLDAVQSCFGVTMSGDGKSFQAANDQITDIYKDYNSSACADGSQAGISDENWERVRFYIFDSETADSMSCYEGDDQSCQNSGFNSTTTDSSTPSSSDTGSPVAASGTAAQIATQLLGEWGKNLTGTPYVKKDLEATSQGKTINNSDTCGKTISIDANLLQVLLTATSKYKLYLDNIVSGHGCDQFLHPKGRASDIGGATDLATNKSTNFCSNGDQGCSTSGDDQTLDHQFYIYLASILPSGGEMGQDECAGRTGIDPPKGITFFNDTCSHQHVDVGNK